MTHITILLGVKKKKISDACLDQTFGGGKVKHGRYFAQDFWANDPNKTAMKDRARWPCSSAHDVDVQQISESVHKCCFEGMGQPPAWQDPQPQLFFVQDGDRRYTGDEGAKRNQSRPVPPALITAPITTVQMHLVMWLPRCPGLSSFTKTLSPFALTRDFRCGSYWLRFENKCIFLSGSDSSL